MKLNTLWLVLQKDKKIRVFIHRELFEEIRHVIHESPEPSQQNPERDRITKKKPVEDPLVSWNESYDTHERTQGR